MRPRTDRIALLIAWLLTVSLPTLTLVFRPLPPELLFQLPPVTRPNHPSFSPAATVFMVLVVGLILLPFFIRAVRAPRVRAHPRSPGCFPRWGYLSMALLAVTSLLSITRMEFFAPLQIHTFAMVWYSFIALMEALIIRRGGERGWERGTAAYTRLFGLSSIFWWSYEYLNRYLQNWTYQGIEHLTPGEYIFFATAAFATVLPALDAINRYLDTFPHLWQPFRRWKKVVIGRTAAFTLLAVSSAVMLLMPVAPNLLFSFAWVAPLGVLLALQGIIAGEHTYSEIEDGDWSNVVKWMSAGLGCGLLWETWNAGSLARWIYHVPYVQVLHVFEMPILGFAGYLPFALLCGAIIGKRRPKIFGELA